MAQRSTARADWREPFVARTGRGVAGGLMRLGAAAAEKADRPAGKQPKGYVKPRLDCPIASEWRVKKFQLWHPSLGGCRP